MLCLIHHLLLLTSCCWLNHCLALQLPPWVRMLLLLVHQQGCLPRGLLRCWLLLAA
jgi:hypothetical protein